MQLDLGLAEKEGAEPRILSVTEFTRQVRETLEGRFGEIWVRGEISNYRRQASGHHYFTLKDDGSQLPCVLFAGAARALRGLRLADGVQVQVFGEVTVYEARGQYQLVVRLLQEEGVGALQAKFEALKAKLAAEGLFDAERKRPLPKFPARIGVVTSPTGAAIRDFLKVLHRRMPSAQVVINPVRVQGRGAAAEIAAAIAEFEKLEPRMDLIVVTRGGGSLEDLWEFNEEAVARAIASSPIPVVSAVGHEIDFTLSDFAADFRAPTPSAAAELIVPDAVELRAAIGQRVARMLRECLGTLRFLRTHLAGHERSAVFREPVRIVRERAQRLDMAGEAMQRAAQRAIGRHRDRLAHAVAADRMAGMLRQRLSRHNDRLAALGAQLQTLSPDATLARGYSITFDAKGGVVRSARGLREGEAIVARFQDGEASATVDAIRPGSREV
jgi:exodeoxyribonuclease VII large subunit